MSPIFMHAAFLLNRLPYFTKLMLMVTFSLVPSSIFVYLAFSSHHGASLQHTLTVIASFMLASFVYVASAAEEQTSVAEDMNRSINSIIQLSNDTAGAVDQTTSASDELCKLAAQLESLVNQFKLTA